MHPGTAGTLSSIECLIGSQEEGIQVNNVCSERSNPNTHRDLQRQPRGLDEWTLHGKSNPVGNGGGFINIRGWKQNHKLVTSNARQRVFLPQTGLEGMGCRLQDLIANQMSVCIVNLFKVININRQDR